MASVTRETEEFVISGGSWLYFIYWTYDIVHSNNSRNNNFRIILYILFGKKKSREMTGKGRSVRVPPRNILKRQLAKAPSSPMSPLCYREETNKTRNCRWCIKLHVEVKNTFTKKFLFKSAKFSFRRNISEIAATLLDRSFPVAAANLHKLRKDLPFITLSINYDKEYQVCAKFKKAFNTFLFAKAF